MMNTRQHWFAVEQAAGVAATGSPASAEGSPRRHTAEENRAANNGMGAGVAEPEAKRQRVSDAAPAGPQPSACPPPHLDRNAVLGWISAQGTCTGPQLLARFDGGSGAPDVRQQLTAMLASLCCDFEVARRGGASASSSLIDLDDPDVQFLVV
jgi:hypothetical protein